MTFEDVVLFFGYGASALVFAAFFMRSRTRLRQVAIAGNVAFITYAILGHVIPVLVLHIFLLPLNIWRLWELARTREAIVAAIRGDLRLEWLEPYGTSLALKQGDQLFAEGDAGDTIYFVMAGIVHLIESGITLEPGALLGEMAIFSPQGKRTQSAVAGSDARLLAMSPEEVLTLYRRHPDFGVYLLRLVTGRLLENNRRLQALAKPAPG